jgi:hypothetical protein
MSKKAIWSAEDQQQLSSAASPHDYLLSRIVGDYQDSARRSTRYSLHFKTDGTVSKVCEEYGFGGSSSTYENGTYALTVGTPHTLSVHLTSYVSDTSTWGHYGGEDQFSNESKMDSKELYTVQLEEGKPITLTGDSIKLIKQ